jgi:hypothetical protein
VHSPNLVAVNVHNIAIVVDLLANKAAKVAFGQFTDEVTVGIAHFTLTGDLAASHGVDFSLLLLRLPALGLANHVVALVEDFAVLVNLAARELIGVSFDDTTDNTTRWVLNNTISANSEVLDTFRPLLLVPGDELNLADYLAIITPDFDLAIDLSSGEALAITGDAATRYFVLGPSSGPKHQEPAPSHPRRSHDPYSGHQRQPPWGGSLSCADLHWGRH